MRQQCMAVPRRQRSFGLKERDYRITRRNTPRLRSDRDGITKKRQHRCAGYVSLRDGRLWPWSGGPEFTWSTSGEMDFNRQISDDGLKFENHFWTLRYLTNPGNDENNETIRSAAILNRQTRRIWNLKEQSTMTASFFYMISNGIMSSEKRIWIGAALAAHQIPNNQHTTTM